MSKGNVQTKAFNVFVDCLNWVRDNDIDVINIFPMGFKENLRGNYSYTKVVVIYYE